MTIGMSFIKLETKNRIYHFREPFKYKLNYGAYQHNWKSKASVSIICFDHLKNFKTMTMCVTEEFDVLYKEYAEERDSKLTSGAIKFKNELRNMVDWIEEKKK